MDVPHVLTQALMWGLAVGVVVAALMILVAATSATLGGSGVQPLAQGPSLPFGFTG
jgi:hypothetical protein